MYCRCVYYGYVDDMGIMCTVGMCMMMWTDIGAIMMTTMTVSFHGKNIKKVLME